MMQRWLCCLLIVSIARAFAADATAGLLLCTDPSGIDNVVSAANRPAGAQCRPYSASALKKGSTQTAASRPAPMPSATVTTPKAATAKPDFSHLRYAEMSRYLWQYSSEHPTSTHVDSLPSAPLYKSDAIKIYLCTVNGEPRIVEGKRLPKDDCQVMGAKGTDVAALMAPAATQAATPTADPAMPATAANMSSKASSDTRIYLCQADGKQSLIEADAPPQAGCTDMGGKGEASPSAATEAPRKQMIGDSAALKQNETSIETTESPPSDIYKCFDHNNLPTYVNADERENYHHCRFFSRSFAGVTQQLRQQAQGGAAAVVTGGEVIGPRLTCSGAGTLSYRGQVREFDCAAHSYNYSPGSTGGEIRLGSQYAAVPAYNQDYLGTSGSCGGTITSESGRVLHLEPTKDCPPALLIEARRIAQQVHNDLNIKVSGAFLQRQQGLSAQINQIAAEVGVDPFLVHAVISAESAYKQRAVSHAGAQGLMQLMPATARRFNVSDPFHSGQNIRGGTTYLRWLLKEFNGNMELAVAGYNAGEGNVRKYGYQIPPFIETKAYVPKVMQYYRKYRANPSQVGL